MISDFISMNGYGAFVWSSFAFTFFVCAIIYYRTRKCTSTHGCDELYNGEIVQVEGMQQNFTAYLYDNHTLMYDPVL